MISTRLVELVIDTVVCLTLAKWETVSGQFGGYLNPMILVAHPLFPAKTVPELIDYAKSNPRKVTMASFGIGTAGGSGDGRWKGGRR